MPPKLQNEPASMLTALYCVTMIKVKIHQLFQGEACTNTFWSNNTKCVGYIEYKVKVIDI